MQIRDGLHIFTRSPRDGCAPLPVALSRTPRGYDHPGQASLLRALADDLGLGFDPLDCRMGDAWKGPKPTMLATVSDEPWRTTGDTVERLELLAATLVSSLRHDGLGKDRGRPRLNPRRSRTPRRCLRRCRKGGLARWPQRTVHPARPFGRADAGPAGRAADRTQFLFDRHPFGADRDRLGTRPAPRSCSSTIISSARANIPRPSPCPLGHRQYAHGRRRSPRRRPWACDRVGTGPRGG